MACIAQFYIGILATAISVILIEPTPICLSSDGSELPNCSVSQVCSFLSTPGLFPDGQNFYFGFAFKDSWTEQFQLYCGRSYLLGTSKTTIFLINTVLIFFNNQITNFSGRKSALLIVCFFSLVFLIPLFVDNLFLKVIGFGLGYGSINSIDGLLPPVVTEATNLNSRIPEVVLSIAYTINSSAIVIFNLSLVYLSYGPNSIFIGCCFFSVFCFLPWVFFMAESPVFLFRKGKVKRLVQSLHRISTINFKKIKKNSFFEDIIGPELAEKLLMEKKVRIQVMHIEEKPAKSINSKSKVTIAQTPLLTHSSEKVDIEEEDELESSFVYVSLTHFVLNPQ